VKKKIFLYLTKQHCLSGEGFQVWKVADHRGFVLLIKPVFFKKKYIFDGNQAR